MFQCEPVEISNGVKKRQKVSNSERNFRIGGLKSLEGREVKMT